MPELKQFEQLSPLDFDRHPVWVACHMVDSGEPWHGETNEETFRPWTAGFPVTSSEAIFLVRATFEEPDGSHHPGFITPALSDRDLGTMQPQMFVGGGRFGFWGGIVGITEKRRQAFYAAIRKDATTAFPLRFSADPRLATGTVAGQVDGFYRSNGSNIQIEY